MNQFRGRGKRMMNRNVNRNSNNPTGRGRAPVSLFENSISKKFVEDDLKV